MGHYDIAMEYYVIYQSEGNAKKVITVYHTLKIGKLVSSKTTRGAWRKIH